jgi:hypothetical protein
MKPRCLACVVAVAVLALGQRSPAQSESARPVAAPPLAAALPPPAAPPAIPAAPPKGAAVILAAPPAASGVLGGKVEFAGKAFPIVVEGNDAAVQAALRNAQPLPCQACRATGKIIRS